MAQSVAHSHPSSMSVIIPALNEETVIGETLDHLRAAEEFLTTAVGTAVQLLVVNSGSTDRTAAIAQDRGAAVIHEAGHNIAMTRNAGARAAVHGILVFIDADTRVPPSLLQRIGEAMTDPDCLGGAVDTAPRPRRRLIRAYLKLWRALGLVVGMAQGACQFCRRQPFVELGGYDETLYMGEDVDFYWRLRTLARRRGFRTSFIRDVQVVPSARRFDRWPLWQTLVWTNPLVVLALRRRGSAWPGWYHNPPR